MDAVVEHERLDLPEGFAAAAGSFVAMAVTVLVMLLAMTGLDELGPLVLVVLVYATPVWLVGFLLIGLPAAVWIENRTRMGSARRRRYTPYAAVGMVVGGLLLFVLPIAAPAALASAIGGRAGVEVWRRWDARHERPAR